MKINNKINPEKDGVEFINMYSKAKTSMGRMISNFYHFPIETEDGHFESVEGYWYWLSLPVNKKTEIMRRLYGYKAKQTGRELRQEYGEENLRFDDRFEEKILAAIRYKVERNKNLIKDKYKDLPIIHYYTFDGKVFDVTEDFPWLVNGITEIVKSV